MILTCKLTFDYLNIYVTTDNKPLIPNHVQSNKTATKGNFSQNPVKITNKTNNLQSWVLNDISPEKTETHGFVGH